MGNDQRRAHQLIAHSGSVRRRVSQVLGSAACILVLAGAAHAAETAPAFPALPETLSNAEVAYDAAWDAAPLSFRTATFVTKAATASGQYTPRASSTFKPDEALIVYAEPVGYTFSTASDGKDVGSHRFALSAGYELRNPGGQILAKGENFAKFAGESRNRQREFQTSLTFHFNGVPQGSYILQVTFNDDLSDKSAKIQLPFEISDRP